MGSSMDGAWLVFAGTVVWLGRHRLELFRVHRQCSVTERAAALIQPFCDWK